MRLSLPFRIVLVQLLFVLVAAGAAAVLVGDAFQRYEARWYQELQTFPAEQLIQPLINEVARSLLLRLDPQYPEEVRERDKQEISSGLTAILRELPSIQSVLVVDRAGRIQFASQEGALDLGFTSDEELSFLASSTAVRKRLSTEDGKPLTKAMFPIFDVPGPSADRSRLGSLIVLYTLDPALAARSPQLRPPSIDSRDFVVPVVLFLAIVAVSGILIAVLTGLPVRRLDRALTDFRARGFRGGLDLHGAKVAGGIVSAVDAINEMGGRLERLDAQGREREALLATLGQSLEEGMIALDPDEEPVAWNPAALRILGVSPAAPRVGEELERQRAAMLEALRRNPELTQPTSGMRARMHELDLSRGGVRVPVRVTQVPFEARPGQQGILLLLRDLAALSKVEQHLLEAGRFAGLAHLGAGLAHEIRNPLHAISLNAGVVEQYLGMQATTARRAAMAESLTSIKDETRRLTDLLNNYLGLVRWDPVVGPVDVTELCRRVQQLLAYSAQQAGIEIRVHGGGNIPPIDGIAARLQQAVLNLVLNSIQAMPEGGTVWLQTESGDGVVRLTVADTGPGLPADNPDELFQMRMTTKPEGTGLGLPLVRMIAEAHGGRISYRPRPGGGAAMTISLPIRAAA